MRLKRFILLSVLCIAVLGLTQTSWSEVKIATGDYPPFTSETMDGKGFFSEIVTAAFKEMGEEVSYSFFPWKRCESVVQKGDFFAAIPYSKSEEREKIFDFSDIGHVSEELLFYYAPQNDLSSFNYTKYSDLKPYKIAGMLGYYYIEAMKKEGLKLDNTPNEIAAFKKLIGGRVDLIPIDKTTGMTLIKENFPNELANIKTVKNPLGASYSLLMISRKYPDAKALTEKFNMGLKKIQENGIYDAILKKHNLL